MYLNDSLNEIIENFEFIEDWEEKYIYLIDLGKKLPPFDLNEKINKNLVEGCTSKVWITKNILKDDKFYFNADSESTIVKGLVALILIIYNSHTAQEILNINVQEIFEKLDLDSHLSMNRANGLRAMVSRILNEVKNV